MNTNAESNHAFKINNLSVFYGEKEAVKKVSFNIQEKKVTAVIGPSGCGKSTMLRCFNRMNDFITGLKVNGKIYYGDTDIYGSKIDAANLRRKIGMVFQKPNPFPKSIYKNIAWGPKVNGFEGDMDELIETSLQRAALWDEVKDRLNDNAFTLSGGQQQRLCIARAIAMNPEVILMDEPCSALDPNATSRIETLIHELKNRFTIIIVTHNMQQAARVSDQTAFFYEGSLVEFGQTDKIFTNPREKRTEDYITGRFG